MTRTDESHFRPRARLVSLLGEQLISDSAVGLVELVKNAYDADATRVDIQLEELHEPEDSVMVIHDNGHGMTPTEVREHWLSPATGHKESQKARAERTPMGRQLIGEKGVGRFAVQRLGRRVRLITRAMDHPEVRVEIDWSDFEEREAYLDEVKVQVRIMKRATQFSKDTSGTRLEMYGARTRWTGVELRKVQRLLRRLQNPLRASNDFHVTLSCPDYPKYEDIDPAGILERAHYTFDGHVDAEGTLRWSYECALPGVPARSSEGEDRLQELVSEELQVDTPRCGPLDIHLHVWDRSRDMMKAVDLTDRELNSHCGISVYRDGFRVLPYGERGDDWLGLDARRINVPSRRVGNRNIVGVVEISHDQNPRLRDRTSREGLIENDAQADLRAMVRGAIMVLELERLRDRQTPKSRGENLEVVRALEAPGSPQALPLKMEAPAEAGAPPAREVASPGAATSTRQARHFVASALHERVRQERHEELYTLAAHGLRLDRLGHEFSRHADLALHELTRMRRDLDGQERLLERVESVQTTLNILRNAMRDLVPDGLVSQVERTSTFGLGGAFEEALRLNADALSRHEITVLEDGQPRAFELRARRSCIVQVLTALLDNAIHWAHHSNPPGQGQVRVRLDAERHVLLVGDNGRGVDAHHRERIFEPYFSLRPEGRGLGLHIARDLMRHQGGNLFLVHPDEALALDARGATFCVALPPSPGGGS